MDIRPSTPADHQRVLKIYNQVHHDRMPLTLEDYRGFISGRPADKAMEMWVAEDTGRVVGTLDLAELWSAARPGAWELYLEVDRDQRGRGIGSRLYEHLMDRVQRLDVHRLYATVREDDAPSLAFAARRGFQPTGRIDRESRLTVADANLTGFAGLEKRLTQDGIVIRTLAEIGMEDESFMRALHAMNEVSMHDVPGSEELQPRPYEFWVEYTLKFPGNSPEQCWVALDGSRPIGIARVRRVGNLANNAYTGVDRAYRGRGIARGLKLRTVQWAQANGIDYFFTGNDIENHRMLDINIRLGYQQLPASIEVVKAAASR
jgi:mycothiol synthase